MNIQRSTLYFYTADTCNKNTIVLFKLVLIAVKTGFNNSGYNKEIKRSKSSQNGDGLHLQEARNSSGRCFERKYQTASWI